jgi:hypothetical protein
MTPLTLNGLAGLLYQFESVVRHQPLAYPRLTTTLAL